MAHRRLGRNACAAGSLPQRSSRRLPPFAQSAKTTNCGAGWPGLIPHDQARNEEVVREVNAQIADGARLHGVDSPMPLHCECGQATCLEKIELRPSRYERILVQRYRFIVARGHQQPEVERVVESQESFLIVEKIGEAREQIDRDHPQQQHRDA